MCISPLLHIPTHELALGVHGGWSCPQQSPQYAPPTLITLCTHILLTQSPTPSTHGGNTIIITSTSMPSLLSSPHPLPPSSRHKRTMCSVCPLRRSGPGITFTAPFQSALFPSITRAPPGSRTAKSRTRWSTDHPEQQRKTVHVPPTCLVHRPTGPLTPTHVCTTLPHPVRYFKGPPFAPFP